MNFLWICPTDPLKCFLVTILLTKARKSNYYDLCDMAFAKAKKLYDDREDQEETWQNPN